LKNRIHFEKKIKLNVKIERKNKNTNNKRKMDRNYQLFAPDVNEMIMYNIPNNVSSNLTPLTPDYFKITKEELENIKNKKVINILSKHIQKVLSKDPNKQYNLTKYTLFVIDELQADILISCEIDTNNIKTYFYKIVSKNIYYEIDDDEEDIDKTKDLVIYDNYGFSNLIAVLEDIKYVEKNYKLLDYYLLSPDSMEEAIAQREFMPIHADKICSVCHEPTIEYTTCKHYICLKCREKCIVNGNKTCPICRTSSLCIYPL
jgi:hypothetical protein